MNEMQAEHLALAQRHVIEGEQRVARQVALIAELERDGYDTRDAKEFCETLEETLALMHAHLQLILDEIAGEAV